MRLDFPEPNASNGQGDERCPFYRVKGSRMNAVKKAVRGHPPICHVDRFVYSHFHLAAKGSYFAEIDACHYPVEMFIMPFPQIMKRTRIQHHPVHVLFISE